MNEKYADLVEQLFSSSIPTRKFDTSDINHIPSFGSIIYTVFLDEAEFIYVGIGGLAGKAVNERNPRSRICQHSQGNRSGDQFCIYIQDFYVLHELLGKEYSPKKGYLDQLTKDFIRNRLSYRYVVIQADDSDKVVRHLEREIQSGRFGNPLPKLNSNSK